MIDSISLALKKVFNENLYRYLSSNWVNIPCVIFKSADELNFQQGVNNAVCIMLLITTTFYPSVFF